MGIGFRDYVIDRQSADESGKPLRLDLSDTDWLSADSWPRQIARVLDPLTRSEWVVDLRRFGDHLQIRAVEYSAEGMWMPHAWRQLPRGAEIWFSPGETLQVRLPRNDVPEHAAV